MEIYPNCPIPEWCMLYLTAPNLWGQGLSSTGHEVLGISLSNLLNNPLLGIDFVALIPQWLVFSDLMPQNMRKSIANATINLTTFES